MSRYDVLSMSHWAALLGRWRRRGGGRRRRGRGRGGAAQQAVLLGTWSPAMGMGIKSVGMLEDESVSFPVS